jgi:dephospho-CoA kinase
MRIVAISGGTGTGKTTLLDILGRRGYGVLNADMLTRKVLGEDIDLPALRAKFFSDPEFRKSHERRIRPKVYMQAIKEVAWMLLSGKDTIFIEIPLLFELRLNGYFYTIVVSCDEDVEWNRIKEMEYIRERLELLIPLGEKVRMADMVIYNNGTIEELEKHVSSLDFGSCNLYSLLAMLLLIGALISNNIKET